MQATMPGTEPSTASDQSGIIIMDTEPEPMPTNFISFCQCCGKFWKNTPMKLLPDGTEVCPKCAQEPENKLQ
jgi:hypothetical protein